MVIDASRVAHARLTKKHICRKPYLKSNVCLNCCVVFIPQQSAHCHGHSAPLQPKSLDSNEAKSQKRPKKNTHFIRLMGERGHRNVVVVFFLNVH